MAESTLQREAFDTYWQLGAERSIELLHAALLANGTERTLRTLYTWSSRYHWQDRLLDLERQARVAAEEARQEEIREMYERQAKEGLLLQQRGAGWLSSSEAETASPEAAIRAVVEGARLERLARGEPGERTHQEGEMIYGEIALDNFTNEELRRVVEIAKQGAGGAGKADTQPL